MTCSARSIQSDPLTDKPAMANGYSLRSSPCNECGLNGMAYYLRSSSSSSFSTIIPERKLLSRIFRIIIYCKIVRIVATYCGVDHEIKLAGGSDHLLLLSTTTTIDISLCLCHCFVVAGGGWCWMDDG